MKNSIIIVLLKTLTSITLFSQNFPFKLSRISEPICESRVKVSDERPNNCEFDGNYYMFPVLEENFDHKEDLPNNWMFNNGSNKDDSWEANGNGLTWMGDPYNNGNLYTIDGIGYIETFKQSTTGAANSNVPVKSYDFTGGILHSIFGLRQGIFEARIKFPDNNNFFPAFWLQSKGSIDQEIDIVEFFDANNDGGSCSNYHQMKMTIHNRSISPNKDCKRGRKFPVPNNFFTNFHVYKCVWTDYKIDFYLDNTLVGYARKYYDGPYWPSPPCEKHTDSGVPNDTRDCNYMSNANSCDTYLGWPFNECIKWNQVDKDESFPKTNNPMRMILNSVIYYHNPNYGTNLFNNWPAIDNRRMGVDWVKIYQPITCSQLRQFNNISELKSITDNTNFVSGSKIQIGNSSNSSTFENTMQNFYLGQEFPIHLLASDEIEINGDAIFDEGTFLRLETIDCSAGFNQFQRSYNSIALSNLTDEEINKIEKRQNDSLRSVNIGIDKNSLFNSDHSSIIVYPNPSDNKINFNMEENDYYNLNKIELIDVLGRTKSIDKCKELNIQELISGVYKLKFIFNYGIIVIKTFVKK